MVARFKNDFQIIQIRTFVCSQVFPGYMNDFKFPLTLAEDMKFR